MSYIVVERVLEEPFEWEVFREIYGQARACLDLHRARLLRSYLASDALRVTCLFEAPDAEAVRDANRQAGLPVTRVWPASLHRPPAGGPSQEPGSVVLVEREFDAPAVFEEIQAREHAGAWCMDQHDVRFVRTYFARDRKRMICLYAAPDAESVRIAQHTIGMPVTRVWPATVRLPPD